MTSKLGFRQHILLLLFLDIFIIMFIGFGSKSFLSDFISTDNTMILSSTVGIGLIFVTIFIAITSISVTTGSNFVGVTGIIAGLLGKGGGGAAIIGTVLLVVTDYVLIYQIIIGGTEFGWFNIIGMLIFFPLIVDSLFAAVDWSRGANT